MFKKIKMPKMPKIKMPNVGGNLKELAKRFLVKLVVKQKCCQRHQRLNPFKK